MWSRRHLQVPALPTDGRVAGTEEAPDSVSRLVPAPINGSFVNSSTQASSSLESVLEPWPLLGY